MTAMFKSMSIELSPGKNCVQKGVGPKLLPVMETSSVMSNTNSTEQLQVISFLVVSFFIIQTLFILCDSLAFCSSVHSPFLISDLFDQESRFMHC